MDGAAVVTSPAQPIIDVLAGPRRSIVGWDFAGELICFVEEDGGCTIWWLEGRRPPRTPMARERGTNLSEVLGHRSLGPEEARMCLARLMVEADGKGGVNISDPLAW